MSAQSSALPWTTRLIESAPVSPLLVGAGVALGWAIFSIAVLNVLGCLRGLDVEGRPLWLHPWLWLETWYPVVMGWGVILLSLVRRAAATQLDALERTSALDPRERQGVMRTDPRTLRLAGAFAVAFTLLSDVGYFANLTESVLPPPRQRWIGFLLLQDMVLVWFTLRAVVALIGVARRFSRLGERAGIDLFDLRATAPFARLGLTFALLALVGFALGAPLIPPTLVVDSDALAAFGLAAMCFPLFVGGFVLVLPIRGVRRAVIAAKTAELEEVRAQISREREAALGADEEGKTRATARLPGLLAYESRVESVREWPLDAPVLLRFALYVLLPLGSWVAAALVERGLGIALD